MELSSSLTSVGLGDVEGFGGLLGIPLDQPHALEALGTKRRRWDVNVMLNYKYCVLLEWYILILCENWSGHLKTEAEPAFKALYGCQTKMK